MDNRVAVCICSRGLVHSRTIDRIEHSLVVTSEVLGGVLLFSHDLPIPDAQNEITARALLLNPTHVWYVEEDIVPNLQFLEVAFKESSPVVVANYKLVGGSDSCRLVSSTGNLAYSGMGCLLVKTSVLQEIPRPWFDTKLWKFDLVTGSYEAVKETAHYGGHDVSFFVKLHQRGIPVSVLPEKYSAEHWHVVEMGIAGSNQGFHRMEPLK